MNPRHDTSYLYYLCSSPTLDNATLPHRTCNMAQVICFVLQYICPKQLNIRHINKPRADSSLSGTSCIHLRIRQLLSTLPRTLNGGQRKVRSTIIGKRDKSTLFTTGVLVSTIGNTRLESDCPNKLANEEILLLYASNIQMKHDSRFCAEQV